jgi:hypothetical protein
MAQTPRSDTVIHPSQFAGGSGPRDPTVDERLARLETAVDDIRAELKAIRAEMAAFRVDLARMDGKISNIPTTFQLVFMLATFAVTAFVGTTGLSLAILKLAH